jgi:hypothetical protein
VDLIAKRRVAETWREAVAARSGADPTGSECLRRYDALRASGVADAEAAYLALAEAGLLWPLPASGSAVPTGAEPAGS